MRVGDQCLPRPGGPMHTHASILYTYKHVNWLNAKKTSIYRPFMSWNAIVVL